MAKPASAASRNSHGHQDDDSEVLLAGADSTVGLDSGDPVGVAAVVAVGVAVAVAVLVAVAVAVAVAVTVLLDVTVRAGVRGGSDDVDGGRADWVGDGSGGVRVGRAGLVRVTDFVGLGRAALTLGEDVRLVSGFGRSPDPPPHDVTPMAITSAAAAPAAGRARAGARRRADPVSGMVTAHFRSLGAEQHHHGLVAVSVWTIRSG